jgi:hypothetical protein
MGRTKRPILLAPTVRKRHFPLALCNARSVSDDRPNVHIEHRDGALECLDGPAPECDHEGKPARQTPCWIAYGDEPCPYCSGEGLLPECQRCGITSMPLSRPGGCPSRQRVSYWGRHLAPPMVPDR